MYAKTLVIKIKEITDIFIYIIHCQASNRLTLLEVLCQLPSICVPYVYASPA